MKIQGTPINNYLDPKWRRRPVFTRTMLTLIICVAQIIPTATINSQTPRSGGAATAAQQVNQERDINAIFYEIKAERTTERIVTEWGYTIVGQADRQHRHPDIAYCAFWIDAA